MPDFGRFFAQPEFFLIFYHPHIHSASTTLATTPEIVGEKVSMDLRKLRDDETVKAVILRVNSPGGSAFASEQIWNGEVKLK